MKVRMLHTHGIRRAWRMQMVLALAFTLISPATAQTTGVTRATREAGFSYERAVQHFPGLVREQLFVRFPLQWQREVSQSYDLKSYLELAAGDMGRDGHDPTLVSVGVQLRLDPTGPRDHIYYLAAFSPTLLTNTTFGRETMGTSLEFTTQLAIGVYLGEGRKMALEFSLRHTSNGGLSKHNPGVNTLGLSTVYHF